MTNPATRPGRDHRLFVERLELVGGGREVDLRPGLNLVRGDITTGKTTFVRLLRSLLGTVPDQLPPEVDLVTAVRGQVRLGTGLWKIYRPVTTTTSAAVELSSIAEPEADPDSSSEAIRLPVAGRTASYSRFLLDRLGLPAVEVPRAALKETESLQPVTMTDWLGYCIVTGDELDLQVFGHRDTWRDRKRRWVFQLAYGFYDVELASLNADLRRAELRLEALESEALVLEKFLTETPFADRQLLQQAIADREQELLAVRERQVRLAREGAVADVSELRSSLLAMRLFRDQSVAVAQRLQNQLQDLKDLEAQLQSQSARLTRAIVSDEWLVDFDFIVCPRCGSSVQADRPRTAGHCYLCLQEEHPRTSREALLAEQSRIVSQIAETRDVIEGRARELAALQAQQEEAERSLTAMSVELDARTQAFVSDRAAEIRHHASVEASIKADLSRLREYLALHERFASHGSSRQALEAARDDIVTAIESHQLGLVEAESHVVALERRLLEYLEELHIPQLGDLLTATIDRKTFMPIISGRKFDELSSQGLKTIVNVAHAVAHHTVAIDRDLPLPGFLVLDGLSANAGAEGYDRARIVDLYNLLIREAARYQDRLQLVAVDNVIPEAVMAEVGDRIVLTLHQGDRLIRSPLLDQQETATQAGAPMERTDPA